MTYRYEQTSRYGNLDPLIQYGDGWIYGAVTPTIDVAVPTNVYVLHEKDYNIISWKNSSDKDMTGYYVYRSKTFGHGDATAIAFITSKDSNDKVQTCYIDYLTPTEETVQYYYAVVAISTDNYPSLLSTWAADINVENSFTQYKYLYTDQTTQTYFSTLDMYKKLGNFDTDRNVIPYRDTGNRYIQRKNDQDELVNVPIKKDCNYLYASLLPIDKYNLTNFNDLEFKLYIDDQLFGTNKPLWLTSVTAHTDETSLGTLYVNKDTFFSRYDTSRALGEDYTYSGFETFKYKSNIIYTPAVGSSHFIGSLVIDRNKYFSYFYQQQSLPSNTIIFTYINGNWLLNNQVVDLKETFGITYSSRSSLGNGDIITVNEYWTRDDITEYTEINTSFDSTHDLVYFYDEQATPKSYGVFYRYVIPEKDTTVTVDFNRQAFIYFRVPYIFNSKLLQTYIKDNLNLTTSISNKYNFKTYNYLIFPSVLGKIFNNKQIELKQLKGDLYKTDAQDDAIYKNFGSYFDLEQPAWMGGTNYRLCVLGDDITPGLLDAGINGGTIKGLQQAINAFTSFTATLTDQSTTNYLAVYSNAELISEANLPVIKKYSETSTYTLNDIVAHTLEIEQPVSTNSLTVSSVLPVDASITLLGNATQTENTINIEPGVSAISGVNATSSYTITDCDTTEDVFEAPTTEYNYFMYITNSTNSASSITLADTAPTTPSTNDYWYCTLLNSTNTLYQYDGTDWNAVTTALLCKALIDVSTEMYYYFIPNKGLHQLLNATYIDSNNKIVFDTSKYFINVNNKYKNKYYKVLSSDNTQYIIYKLNGLIWTPISSAPLDADTNWIFKDSYTTSATTDPIAYTHNYLINTWNLYFTQWKKSVTNEKYVVYGDAIKVNNSHVIDDANFIVSDYVSRLPYTRGVDYSFNTDTSTITWLSTDTKPKDGSYVLISYTVDIREELIRLINLIKYPQVHINYIWVQ